MSENNKIYEEGYDAYRTGQPMNCPYPENSLEYDLWLMGWEDSEEDQDEEEGD